MSTIIIIISSVLGIGHWIMPVDAPQPADAIVVVSGGGEERLDKGLELYEEGYSDLLVFAGDAMDPESPSNAEVMRDIAVSAGVPENNILIDPYSKTTNENAINVKQLLTEHQIKPKVLILVTSAYHQRRLLQNFQHVYIDNPDITFINQPADVNYWSRTMWWVNDVGFTITIKEFVKVLWGGITGNLAG